MNSNQHPSYQSSYSIEQDGPQDRSLFLPFCMILVVITAYALIDLFRPEPMSLAEPQIQVPQTLPTRELNLKGELPAKTFVATKNLPTLADTPPLLAQERRTYRPSSLNVHDPISPAPMAMPELAPIKRNPAPLQQVNRPPQFAPQHSTSMSNAASPVQIKVPITRSREGSMRIQQPSSSEYERLGKLLFSEIERNGGMDIEVGSDKDLRISYNPEQGRLQLSVEEPEFPMNPEIGNQAQGCGCFTPWLPQQELNMYILAMNKGYKQNFWERGHCVCAVEGRLNKSGEEYRLIYNKSPKSGRFQWYYKVGISSEEFDQCAKVCGRKGLILVQSQMYRDQNGAPKYQAVWHRK